MDDKLNTFINQQNDAIKILYEQKLHLPSLMILYASLDILGYISGLGFDRFFNKFMKNELSEIKSIDLWGGKMFSFAYK